MWKVSAGRESLEMLPFLAVEKRGMPKTSPGVSVWESIGLCP